MERVTTTGLAERICEMLRDEYLTGAEAQKIRCAVGVAESRLGQRRRAEFQASMEAYRRKLAAFEARAGAGVIPPRPWTAADEAEAVAQGQDGPDPVYEVAPRFGGAEARAVPADRPEGCPDALAPVYEVQRQQAAMTEVDRCPLTGDAPAVPFTDEQEGE